jgi:hypothetical protein
MSPLRTVLAATFAACLWAAPAALATTVGDSSASPTANLCAGGVDCTYVNYRHNKPTDVVKRSGTLSDFSVNAGSVGGQVQLRVLRPVGHGRLKVIRSSPSELIAAVGVNTFSVALKVKAGDVLALSNATSGIYMATAPAGTCVRYFDASLPDGSVGRPDQAVPQLHLLLSADVSS